MSVLDYKLPIHKYFEEISAIPRGSYNEKAISEYLVGFAVDNGLRYYRDEKYNVVIYKDATHDSKSESAVMLQCHTDMICEKDSGYVHDFKQDPLKLKEADGFLTAEGTTLGADNGTGMSYILAILADNTISHPQLECVFTAMEEVGMLGAAALDAGVITAKRLISLDGGGENATCVSSAGGASITVTKAVSYVSEKRQCYKLLVGGLNGGHSGLMIGEGLGNSIKIGSRALYNLLDSGANMRIGSLSGGLKDNSIPREFEATFTSSLEFDEMKAAVSTLSTEISAELAETESGFFMQLTKVNSASSAISEKDSAMLIKMLYLLPDGVCAYSRKLNIPIASLNIGICSLDDEAAKICISVRSPMESWKKKLIKNIRLTASLFDADTEVTGDYPGWAYSEDSPLRDAAQLLFDEKGVEFHISAVHAGLEVGIWKARYPEMDIITLGPIAFDMHSPQERLDLSSFLRTYNYLVELLSRI